MKPTLRGNMLIAQSGGPSAVINQSMVGAVLQAKRHNCIKNIYGAKHGIKGILGENFVDLGRQPRSLLEAVARTPSSAIGTVRKKPTPEECAKALEIFKKYDVRYFFYIGGNDSAETALLIAEQAPKSGHEMKCFHVPKTIDNDLLENDHTPGFGSAARFVACAIIGINLDNMALPGVHISVVMGRHAGFLTASSALARACPDDGPHLIYLPERPFSMDKFTADVESVYSRLGRCIVCVSEGLVDEQGTPIATKFIKEVDAHGNVQLSGSGALGDLLAAETKKRTKISRVRADTFGYLQRSMPEIVSSIDAKEARQVGVAAVKQAVQSNLLEGSIVIRRKPTKKYQVYLDCVSLQKVAKNTRTMPAEFISESGDDVTKAFVDYAKPIVGELPVFARLKDKKAKSPVA